MFGIGGGFLLTPLLIFSGIPTSVAVASVPGQAVAASTSGALSYWRRNRIDLHMAVFLVFSGITGAFLGVWTFTALKRVGQLDLVISFGYLIVLGAVGSLMLVESVRSLIKNRGAGPASTGHMPSKHNWIHGLPFKVRFRRSKLYVSVIPIIVLGVVIGFLGSLLGIGGGFILVPALVYLIRVPGNMVIGTSLVQVLSIMAASTVLQSVNNHSVDALLAFALMIGSVVGAQFGASIGQKLRGEQLRALLALIVLGVAVKFAISLVLAPSDVFSMSSFGLGG